jgi:hypothetical protein
MDTLQQHLSGLHDVVERTWFAPHEPAEAVQARERLAPA